MKTSNKKKLNTTGVTCKEFLDSAYNSIYAYIMTWVYCQLSLEDYSCHVTSRDMSCDHSKFSCEQKKNKKKNGNRIYNKNIHYWHGTLLLVRYHEYSCTYAYPTKYKNHFAIECQYRVHFKRIIVSFHK